MAPQACAQEIVKAIRARKEEVYIGGKEVKGVLFKRLLPTRFSKYIRTAKVL
jgi:dehydrogenase/reductase SDR family protein 7B